MQVNQILFMVTVGTHLMFTTGISPRMCYKCRPEFAGNCTFDQTEVVQCLYRPDIYRYCYAQLRPTDISHYEGITYYGCSLTNHSDSCEKPNSAEPYFCHCEGDCCNTWIEFGTGGPNYDGCNAITTVSTVTTVLTTVVTEGGEPQSGSVNSVGSFSNKHCPVVQFGAAKMSIPVIVVLALLVTSEN